MDTGAQCNVVPLELYRKATKNHKLAHLMPDRQKITAYGGAEIPVIGTVLLRVWRGDSRCRLDCKIVDKSNIRPLLGRKACLGMKMIAYPDNDKMNKLITGSSEVGALNIGKSPLTKEQLIQKYTLVFFSEGVGRLESEYHIRLASQIDPVQHAPRRVPVALRERLKETLEELVQQDIS